MEKCFPAGAQVADEPSSSIATFYPMRSLHVPLEILLPAVTFTASILWTVEH